MIIYSDESTCPSNSTPVQGGWIVEAVIDGLIGWMIKPVPLTSYTFTFDLSQAHIFDREGLARDCMSSVWCWHDRHGQHPPLAVRWIDDNYRAHIAALQPGTTAP